MRRRKKIRVNFIKTHNEYGDARRNLYAFFRTSQSLIVTIVIINRYGTILSTGTFARHTNAKNIFFFVFHVKNEMEKQEKLEKNEEKKNSLIIVYSRPLVNGNLEPTIVFIIRNRRKQKIAKWIKLIFMRIVFPKIISNFVPIIFFS